MSRAPKGPKEDPEQHLYDYFKDSEGRIKRYRLPDPKPRPGYIRLRWLERWYVRYKRASFDSKLIWQPWIIGLATCYFIYWGSNLWSQNDLNREIKARLPFEFKNEQVAEVYRLLREDQKQQAQSTPTQQAQSTTRTQQAQQ